MKEISVIIPCYNEQDNIQNTYQALAQVADNLTQYNWTFLFIDDGSTDQTLQNIKQLTETDHRVQYISLSRNFGKENAMLAGFDHTDADATIIIDADMQHPTQLIPDMITLWEQGYDDIYAQRENRNNESIIRKITANTYYIILQHMAKIDILPNVGDFRLLDNKCICALRKMRETQRYTKGLYCWIGYKKKQITFKTTQRQQGKSSYNYRKLFNLAIEGITSYTTAPLRIATVAGILSSIAALIYMCYILIKTILYGDPVQGYPTLIIVILFLGGIQLLTIGIIGEYLSRIFYETKNRPPYLIQEVSKVKKLSQ